MAIPGFFKQNKPRGFNYVPRYYDPVKEEMEERRRARDTEQAAQSQSAELQGSRARRRRAGGTDRAERRSRAEQRAQGTGHRAEGKEHRVECTVRGSCAAI